MSTPTAPSGTGPPESPPHHVIAGIFFGSMAAVLYTAANIALRKCAGVDPFLVAAMRAVPTVIFLAPCLLWMRFRSLPLLSSGRLIPRFMLVALIGQFVGHVGFQISLQTIGLAVSVPITLGVLIIGGAILGRVILDEPVGRPTMVAIATLVGAIVILSFPSTSTLPTESSSSFSWSLGAICAAAAGAAYALFGVVMRQTLHGGVSASLTMFLSGAVGTVSQWAFALVRLGPESIVTTTTADQWWVMSAAGVLNFFAFVAMSYALKALPVVAVNLINASQVAMAAVAGVWLFAEPVTASLLSGIVLTFIGLSILAAGRHTKRPQECR